MQITFTRLRLSLIMAAVLLCSNVHVVHAQLQNLFTVVDTTVQPLDTGQQARFGLIQAQDIYTSFQFVHVEALSTRLHTDSLLVSFVQPQTCQDVVFLASNAEYEADSDYYWYGKITFVDSSYVSDTTCAVTGHIMLISKYGEIGGQIVTEGLKYNILELGSGLQVIASVNPALEKLATCGLPAADDATSEAFYRKTPGPLCPIRVLVVWTPAAAAADPNWVMTTRIAFYQFREGLRNSAVGASEVSAVLVGETVTKIGFFKTVPHFPIVSYTENTSAAYLNYNYILLKDLKDIATSSPVPFEKANYKADIVVTMVKDENENAKGLAHIFDLPSRSPINVTYAAGYAVVRAPYATIAGYTFAHELGHALGGQHSYYQDAGGSIGHAYSFAYGVTRSFYGLFNTTSHKTFRTLTFEDGAGDTDVELVYSNPQVSAHGQAVGADPDEDAAQRFRNTACDVADINTDNSDFYATIDYPSFICPNQTSGLAAYVSGPTGTYTYAWYFSTNGVTYSPVTFPPPFAYLATSSTIPLSNTSTSPAIVYFKVIVTSPTSQTYTAYATVRLPRNCDYPYFSPYKTQPFSNGGQEAIQLTLSPSPVLTDLQMELHLPTAVLAEAVLYDITGRPVAQLLNQELDKGSHMRHADLSALPSGMYLLRLQAGATIINRTVLIQK